jgi:hypothetical protein
MFKKVYGVILLVVSFSNKRLTIRKENYQEEYRKDSTEDNHFRQTSCRERESYHWSLAKQQSTGQFKNPKQAVVSLTLTRLLPQIADCHKANLNPRKRESRKWLFHSKLWSI